MKKLPACQINASICEVFGRIAGYSYIIWKFGRFELGGGVPIRTDLDGRHPVLIGVPMFENERFESDQMMSYQGIRLNGRSDRA